MATSINANIICGLLLSSLLLGCASTHYYPNTYEKNFTVKLDLADRGGLFTSVSAYVGINDIASDCTSQYQGFITLSPGTNKIGLAPGKTTYLVVEISHRHPGKNSDFSRGTLITPATGKQYEIDVSYDKSMLDIRLYELNKVGRKEIPWAPLSACKSSK